MSVHLFVAARAIPADLAEAHALFLARTAINLGATPTQSVTLDRALAQLGRSTNAAIATEANRLKAAAA